MSPVVHAELAWRCALLAFAVFRLHLVCDLLGSGQAWPIAYLWPLSNHLVQTFPFGWELSSWQNGVIGIAATVACLATARFPGRTIMEVLSTRLDEATVRLVRRLI